MLSFELTPRLLLDLKALDGEITHAATFIGSLNQEARQAIARYAFISNIGASTRIENAVLTNPEIDWMDDTISKDGRPSAFEDNVALIENKISKDKERSIEEVAGCREFLQLVYRDSHQLKPLTEAQIREFHHVLLAYYPKANHYLGCYKTAPNSVISTNHRTGQVKDVLVTADPGDQTKIAMQTLLEWYNRSIDQHAWTVAVACEFISRFLAIHPFQDGNGRMSRGLFALVLMQSGNPDLHALAPYLSTDRSIEENKQEYYFTLQQCSDGRFKEDPSEYKIGFLLGFMIKMLRAALQDIHLYCAKYQALQNLSENAKLLLQCFKDNPQMRLKTGDLVLKLSLPRRTIIYNLDLLMKNKFLQRYGQARGVHYQLIF